MSFKSSSNPYQLTEDVNCTIVGDSVIDCWVRNLMPNKQLIASFTYRGKELLLNDQPAYSDISICDYKAPVYLSIISGGLKKQYTVYVHSFTGLPIVTIETDGRKEIVSKTDYLDATFMLEENVATRAAGDIISSNIQIKGRGNSSWNYTPKKSFRLKFKEKVSIFDEPKDKAWVLISNGFDKSMLRNYIAYYIGKLSNLNYTPSFHFVELILNGQDWGTYLLGDKLKISKNRVNVGDDGYLLEIDQRAAHEDDSPFFYTPHLTQPVNIKDPDMEVGCEAFNYVKEYIIKAEATLFADGFTDPNEGWQKYMDIESFVDWYIIHEIARNYDPLFLYTSAYMNLKRGGKLKMGPIWDFDVTFGNNANPLSYPIEGLVGENSTWFCRLMQDPAFVEKVKQRYEYFYSKRPDILSEINNTAGYLKYAVEEDNNKWNTFYSLGFGNHDVWGCYVNEVQLLKDYIYKRMDWLKSEFDKM